AVTAGFTPVDVGLFGVADLAAAGSAPSVHVADLPRGHPQLGVGAVLGDELYRGTGAASDLRPAPRAELDGVHERTGGDVAQLEVVARLDISGGACFDPVTLLEPVGRQDV